MINYNTIIPQILLLACCFIGYFISFVVIGLANFTTLEWISVALATIGVIANAFLLILKLNHKSQNKGEVFE